MKPHMALGAAEKAVHGGEHGHGDEGHPASSWASQKAKNFVKGAAEIAVPGISKAVNQFRQGETGKALSTAGTGVVRSAIGMATKGASEVLAPTPANAGEDEFARQKGAKMHENVLSKKRTGWTPSPPGTIAYDKDHGKYRALRKAQKEREKAKKEAEEKTVKEELVSELTTKFLKNYTKAAKSKWDEMSDEEEVVGKVSTWSGSGCSQQAHLQGWSHQRGQS